MTAVPVARASSVLAACAIALGALIVVQPRLAEVTACVVLVGAVSFVVPRAQVPVIVLAVAWCAAVFTSEAALGAASADSSTGTTFTVPKLLPLGVLALLALLSLREGIWSTAPTAARLASVYFGWLALAAVLSPTASLSFGRVLQGAGPLFVMLVVRRRIANAGVILLWSTAAATAAHVLWAIYHPYYTGVGTSQVRLVGLLIANSLEFAAGVAVVVGIVVWLSRLAGRRSWLGLLLAAAGAVAIKESVGRTAVLAAVAAVLAALTVREVGRRDASRRALVAGAVAIAALLVLPSYVGNLTGWFKGGDAQLGTLTNRTLIWHTYVPRALNHPFFGLGPGALRFVSSTPHSPLPSFLSSGVPIGQAHNSLIEALIGGGVPAAVLWLAMMSALLFQVVGNRTRYRAMAVGLFVLCVVESITIGQLAGFGMPWYLLLALMALPTEPRDTDPTAGPEAASPTHTPGPGWDR